MAVLLSVWTVDEFAAGSKAGGDGAHCAGPAASEKAAGNALSLRFHRTPERARACRPGAAAGVGSPGLSLASGTAALCCAGLSVRLLGSLVRALVERWA